MLPFSRPTKQGFGLLFTLLAGLTPAVAAPGGGTTPAQLAVSSAVQNPTVYQGDQDPVYGYVYNNSPIGSATLNYTLYANFPLADGSYHYTGTVPANGGAIPATATFVYDTSGVTPGVQNITVTANNTVSGGSATSVPNQVTVLAHPKPALGINGNIVYLNTASKTKFNDTGVPDMTGASLPPQENGTEGPAGGFAPGMIGDPANDDPAGPLDLDSITASGDPEVAIVGLTPFTDLPATDSLSENVVPFAIDLFTNNVGVEYTDTFTLDYSDDQSIPGADAPGSEQLSFTVSGMLNADGSTSWDVVTVPEPSASTLLLAALALLALVRTWRVRRLS